MRARNMNEAIFQQLQRAGAILVADYQLYALAAKMAHQHRRTWIAPRHQHAIVELLAVAQHLDACLRGWLRALLRFDQNAVGLRQTPGARLRRRADQPAVHPAQRHRLSRACAPVFGEQLDLFHTRRRRQAALQPEQLLHRHAQNVGQFENHHGVGDVLAGLNGVNRLPADTHRCRQLGGGNAALLPQLAQIVLHIHRSSAR